MIPFQVLIDREKTGGNIEDVIIKTELPSTLVAALQVLDRELCFIDETSMLHPLRHQPILHENKI